jgi:hypothetical protein
MYNNTLKINEKKKASRFPPPDLEARLTSYEAQEVPLVA